MIIGQDSDNKTYEPKLDICGKMCIRDSNYTGWR